MIEGALMLSDVIPPAADPVALAPQEAKRKVLEHWQRLDALAKRRFPKDENLALQGAQYVMDGLEEDDWQRVREWQGKAEFLPFLVTVASRLLTDYYRKIVGHRRPPQWLDQKQDPLWDAAYRLLAVEHYPAHEAVEGLLCRYPERERWFIEEIVSTIRGKCRIESQPVERVELNNAHMDIVDESLAPDGQLIIKDKEISEALQAYLQGESEAPTSPRVSELLTRLREHLHLTEEDRLLLRLRFQDGLSIQAIARLLHLQGDPYKRMNKLIAELRGTCRRVGFYLEEA
ncbi:MAG: hypothetical protein L0Z68_02040 [Gammaproteobacteria bacterium]|nr:hypothetical protein [Gammaproteobacteria bacterium]